MRVVIFLTGYLIAAAINLEMVRALGKEIVVFGAMFFFIWDMIKES